MAGEDVKTQVLYAEELVREFLLFRGFSNTLRSFETELASDHAQAFQVDQILNLFFSLYIPRFESEKMHSLLAFLHKCFFTPLDAPRLLALRKFETSLKRYYIIHALQKGRIDRVLEFFQRYGSGLLQSDEDWQAWFALPYIKSPHLDSRFQVFFSKEWLDMLILSFGNFLSEIFNSIRQPALVKVSADLLSGRAHKRRAEELSNDNEQLQDALALKEQEISELKRALLACSQHLERKLDSNSTTNPQGNGSSGLNRDRSLTKIETKDVIARFYDIPFDDNNQPLNAMQSQAFLSTNLERTEGTALTLPGKTSGYLEQTFSDGVDITAKDEFPEVLIESQETFSGHISPITRCRFSAGGGNIASSSVDGTVRVWNSDSGSSTSRNATIYCGAEVLSLEWDYKSDRLLLIGTAEQSIKAWNVDAKRVVCDFSTDTAYPRILDLKCNPVEPIFASAASSVCYGDQSLESKEFALVTLWNMKTWKPLTFLPLGEDPPAITSICFNHNGKILAAGATDGMIHLFDTYARLPITGWPAHDFSVSCVKFGPDQASIFSLGADGKVLEWSLHNQGQVLQEHDASRFCKENQGDTPRHEMALDAQGRMLLLTSSSPTAPIYHLQKKRSIKRTLQHNASITSVDWHPSQNKFLTGSADHSVRITSILPKSIF